MEPNNMKNKILSLLLLIAFQPVFSQTSKITYWITFKDKKNTPYSLSRPEMFLSERAIARREKQHITLKERDLPLDPAYVKEIAKFGAVIKSRSKWFNAISIILNDENKIAEIKKLPFVKDIQRIETKTELKGSSKFDLETYTVPEIQKQSSEVQNAESFNYGGSYAQAHQIGADCMHDKGYMGQGMVIAQLDAGFFNVNILPAFDSLRANNQILGCRDFETGDTMVFEDHSHGMNVLSCMGGNLAGQIVGTAPKAKFWLLRTEVAATESLQEEINWAVAAEFADSVGADIINSSLGYSYFDNTADNHTYADMNGNTTIITKAADWAASTGIFVCSSAGNSGGSPWYKITAPADADSVLTVGAVDSVGVSPNFSSRGPTYDGRIKPNTVAQGVHAAIAADWGGVVYANGTSFSSPVTAGAVACLWQANPAKTNMELLNAIQQSASLSATPDSIKGYGIPDFCYANRILSGIPTFDEDSFSIYPNPFKNTIQINFFSSKEQNVLIELFDIKGDKIYSRSIKFDIYSRENFTLSVGDNYAAGMYLLTIKTNDKVYHEKIIKQ
jgi:serine protease AprX